MTIDNYRQAAVRHLIDGRSLLDAGRPDNAVHLAGFAAECAWKAALTSVLPAYLAKNAGHDLQRLAGRDVAWLSAASGDRDLLRIGALPDPLTNGHPERRYWADHWTMDQAREAVDAAEVAVARGVLDRALDRGLALDLA